MFIYITESTVGQPPLPNRDLWRALRVIFNHYLIWELGNFRVYPEGRRPPQSVIEAVRFLDCWLDIASQEGWY